MTIRQATVDDLRNLESLALEFKASTAAGVGFDLDHFVSEWTKILNAGIGVIFLLGDFRGAIAGVAHPDISSGVMVAQEFFFFVHADARGEGGSLYREFEAWAKACGCAQIRMGLLADSMAEKLDVVYRRWGFRKVEVNYAKELIAA